jgi:hypothetical protein
MYGLKKNSLTILFTAIIVLLNVTNAQAQATSSCATDPEREAAQIGSQWDRISIQDSLKLKLATDYLNKIASAVAFYRGGTAFYLGKFNGHYLMATNHHIQPNSKCNNADSAEKYEAYFQSSKSSFVCEHIYGSWKEIELSIFSISVPDEKKSLFDNLGLNFAFNANISSGEPLTTLGYGSACNDDGELTVTDGENCRVFSKKNSFKLLSDPDNENTDDYPTWSFAIGCNASHGDSGSPIVDRNTGNVIGILYTGKFPKSKNIQIDASLQKILGSDNPSVWTELNYAVPAARIKAEIQKYILSIVENPDTDLLSTLRSLINVH